MLCMILFIGIAVSNKILVNENLCENCFYFTMKRFLLNSFWEMCFLEESYKNKQKVKHFDISKSAL